MDLKKAKKTIDVISEKWKIDQVDFFKEVLDKLWVEEKKNDSVQEFEFSLVEKKEKIRWNHLYFLSTDVSNIEKARQREKRRTTIQATVKMIERRLATIYNGKILEKVLLFFEENEKFPLQFGLEYGDDKKPKIKIYLSINGEKFPLRKFCEAVGTDPENIAEIYGQEKLDTVAVDFLPAGKFSLKLYPLISKNFGTLVRISEKETVVSKKIWRRFPKGILLEKTKNSNFSFIPIFLRDYIISSKIRVHYLCLEGQTRSLYFR